MELAQRSGVVLLENDIYSELRYQGTSLPTLKETSPPATAAAQPALDPPGVRPGATGFVVRP